MIIYSQFEAQNITQASNIKSFFCSLQEQTHRTQMSFNLTAFIFQHLKIRAFEIFSPISKSTFAKKHFCASICVLKNATNSRKLLCLQQFSEMHCVTVKTGILYKAEPEPDPDFQKKRTLDLQKKQTLYKNSRVLISNMTIAFKKPNQKIPK